jgi:REP element-mobilizing transposase RayT
MPNKLIPLENCNYYHVYNRGNNREILFKENKDFKYFLHLYDKYIPLIVDTYAWVLMSNHFHFLIRIKEKEEIGFFASLNAISSRSVETRITKKGNKWKTVALPESKTSKSQQIKTINKKPNPSSQFSHLFNSYAKYFNKKYNRTGSLFQKGFSRKLIDSDKYLRYIVFYIHHNPVHHGYTNDLVKYAWSSFQLITSKRISNLKK